MGTGLNLDLVRIFDTAFKTVYNLVSNNTYLKDIPAIKYT